MADEGAAGRARAGHDVDWAARVRAFDGAASAIVAMVASSEVGGGWHEPSILPRLTIGGLSAHVLGVLRSAERRLETTAPAAADIVEPGHGYSAVRFDGDLDRPEFAVVWQDATRLAERGHEVIALRCSEAADRLRRILPAESPERLLEMPRAGTAATLDSYLRTRIVELVVHAADLAESVGLEPPPTDLVASEVTLDLLLESVRSRLGSDELLRALAGRRPPDVLRAL